MKQPALQDRAFIEDVQNARRDANGHEGDRLSLWWVGQSGFLIQWNGQHALLDPYLSNSLTRKYATSDRPHVRLTRRVVAPEVLDFIDVVTSSHSHTDHLDPETLKPLVEANPGLIMVCPEANRVILRGRTG